MSIAWWHRFSAPTGAVAGHGGNRDGAGEGHVRVPHRDRSGGPEPGVTLLAPGAGQPAEGVDAPAGTDRAGAGVGFAERCRIGIPADARAHLAPHDRHPQLITDHSPHRRPGRASRRGPGSGPAGTAGAAVLAGAAVAAGAAGATGPARASGRALPAAGPARTWPAGTA